jgi:hypothetical protein
MWEYPSFVACEVLSFDSGGKFTGNEGDTGTWKSTAKSVTVTFVNDGDFVPSTFKGSLATVGGNYVGLLKEKGSTASFGPEQLVSGNNPFSNGTC